MNLFDKLSFLQRCLTSLVFKKKFPLIVNWNITYRCNLRCKYCLSWKKNKEERKAEEDVVLVKELVNSGTKFISFSGGEPLLKKNFWKVIYECKKNKVRMSLRSNATLIRENIELIKDFDNIQLSLDGPRSVNDMIRGEGSYDKTLEAIDICKQLSIPSSLTTVITKFNLDYISYMLNLGKKYNIKIYFQPANQPCSGSNSEDVCSFISPKANEYRKAVKFLIEEKKKGNYFIGNSISGLKYLSCWPRPKIIKCFIVLLSCIIEPDHTIFLCDMFLDYDKYLVELNNSFRETFEKLSLPHSCNMCWSAYAADVNSLTATKVKNFGKLLHLLKEYLR